jgi:hypothetical protein
MSGMNTRSRRSQGPPQPNYNIPPPPSGAVLSPTPKQHGGRSAAANGGTRSGVPQTACDACTRICRPLSTWLCTRWYEQLKILCFN